MRQSIARLLAVLCLLGIAPACDRGVSSVIEKKQQELRAKAAAAKAGTTRISGQVAISLHQFEIAEKGLFVVPKEGTVFVILDVTFENRGQAEITIGSRYMRLADAAGTAYPRSLVGASKPSPDSTLGPGKSSRGQIAYEVPKDARGLKWFIKAGEGGEEVSFGQTQ
jgi:hypothetical protein